MPSVSFSPKFASSALRNRLFWANLAIVVTLSLTYGSIFHAKREYHAAVSLLTTLDDIDSEVLSLRLAAGKPDSEKFDSLVSDLEANVELLQRVASGMSASRAKTSAEVFAATYKKLDVAKARGLPENVARLLTVAKSDAYDEAGSAAKLEGAFLAAAVLLAALSLFLGLIFITRTAVRSLNSISARYLDTLDKSAIVSFTDLSGRITYVNSRFCTVSGYTAEELLGQYHRIIKSGQHPKEVFVDLWKTITSGKIWSGEICNRAKDGHFYWVKTFVNPWRDPESNKIVGYISVRYEIDKQKEAEQALVQSSKMAALGEMAAGVGHEINNPLMVILGLIGRVKKNAGSAGESDNGALILSDVEKIKETAERIGVIVRGLKTFARRDDEMSWTTNTVGKIVQDTLALTTEKLKVEGVALEVGALPEAVLRCHGVQISQVLLNLINNAVDATEGRPQRRIKIEVEVAEGAARLRVSDTGSGIPVEMRSRLMEPFFTTKEIGKGTGLGLSVSKRIAERHGGTLALDESAAETTFVLTLPIHVDEQAPEKAAA